MISVRQSVSRARFVAGNRISLLGELTGSHRLIYNPLQFRNFHDAALRHAPTVIGAFVELLPQADTYLDVGAGSGAFAAEAMRRGKSVLALEHGRAGRRLAAEQGVTAVPFDLESEVRPPARRHLAYSLEVGEHLPPPLGPKLVGFLADAADSVVFTAAQPGQRGTGHINQRTKDEWRRDFEAAGAEFDAELSGQLAERFRSGGTREYLYNNVMAFHTRPSGG